MIDEKASSMHHILADPWKVAEEAQLIAQESGQIVKMRMLIKNAQKFFREGKGPLSQKYQGILVS